MCWGFLDFILINDHHLRRCADWECRCTPKDCVSFWRLRTIGRIFPAPARCEYDFLSDPGFRNRGADGCYDAVAVCEEGGFEAGGGVQVLAEEEVAVIEGGGVDGDY
jgi:hypothetical protein